MLSLYDIYNNVITDNSLGLGLRGSESSLIDEMAEKGLGEDSGVSGRKGNLKWPLVEAA